ncbi:MAG: transcription termination/antitermination protein NusA [Deltaproteobacteria bacterium]|nr:transcription termination/antitermination protein NusA [Deltaproteobacteria bacterium]
MQSNLNHTLEMVGKEKGIDREILIDALETAMLTAARKKFGLEKDLEVHFNEETGEIEIFEFKTVVKKIEDPETEIKMDEALQLDPEAQNGDSLGIRMDTSELGRIAAQTAKQVLIQKVREADYALVYEEYKDRRGELVTGIVRRFERGNNIVDLGRAEAVLPMREQVPRESYRAGDRIQAYVLDVLEEAKGGPQIILSRTSPGLLIKLFEMEVPEIDEGIVTIEAAAREPGARSKIAVSSRDSDVDPVGACVGMKGSRVQAVVQELRGEKIDIVPFSPDPATFVCNALAPVEVSRVIINEDTHGMEIIVPDDQLSLGIGRKGQNVRLASQLSGWRLDINSESRVAEMWKNAITSLGKIDGVGDIMIDTLYKYGFRSARDIMLADIEQLIDVPGIGDKGAEKMQRSAAIVVADEEKELRVAAEVRKAEAESSEIGMEGEQERFTEIRGIGDKTVEQLGNGGYYTIMQVHEEENIVKLGEVTGIGIKKARQVKQAIATYLEEMARAAILPDVEETADETAEGETEETEAAADETSEGETEEETEEAEAVASEDEAAASPTEATESSAEAEEQQLQESPVPVKESSKEEGAD